MDPNATWTEIAKTYSSGQQALAREHARTLKEWIDNQGFPPNITGNPKFDKLTALAVCNQLRA